MFQVSGCLEGLVVHVVNKHQFGPVERDSISTDGHEILGAQPSVAPSDEELETSWPKNKATKKNYTHVS